MRRRSAAENKFAEWPESFIFEVCRPQKHTVILDFIFSSILEANRESFC
jgi:hypothetical protein